MVRRRTIDLVASRSSAQPSLVCPGCDATMSRISGSDLQPVAHNLFCCAPGRHPRAFEVRCRDCGRRVLVYESGHGLALIPGDQTRILQDVCARDRECEDKPRDRDK